MNEKELRIGNIVTATINGSKRDIKISAITQGSVSEEGAYKETDNPHHPYARKIISKNDIELKPLSESLLFAYGFVRETEEGNVFYSNSVIKLDADFNLMIAGCNIQVSSLHQLQNIHFALTEEEVEKI